MKLRLAIRAVCVMLVSVCILGVILRIAGELDQSPWWTGAAVWASAGAIALIDYHRCRRRGG